MPNRLSLTALSLTALLAATACGDGTTANTPVAPPGRPAPLGIIRGTVSGDSMSAVFVPYGSAGATSGDVSPSIYGSPATIEVTGTFVSLVDAPPIRTWTFNVHMRNLLAYPIGSNYSASNPAPVDTSGVFVFFTTPPFITQGTPCSGCTIAVSNWSGIGNFTNPMQPFFWYKDRPTAVQGSPGTDETSDIPWQFTGTFNPPPGDTVHSFTFALEVSAAWPIPDDTAWTYSYDWKKDSLPDQFAKPRWKTPFAQVNQYTTVGSETFNIGTDLVLTAATGTSSIFIARNDSMNPPKSAAMTVTGSLQNTIAGIPMQAVFGIVQPGVGGVQAVVGIYEDHIAFVKLDPVTGLWTDNPATIAVPVTGTASHRYRLRKVGTLDLYLLCVDGALKSFATPDLLDPREADFNTTTVFFGAVGNAVSAANFHMTEADYVVGTDGGSC